MLTLSTDTCISYTHYCYWVLLTCPTLNSASVLTVGLAFHRGRGITLRLLTGYLLQWSGCGHVRVGVVTIGVVITSCHCVPPHQYHQQCICGSVSYSSLPQPESTAPPLHLLSSRGLPPDRLVYTCTSLLQG